MPALAKIANQWRKLHFFVAQNEAQKGEGEMKPNFKKFVALALSSLMLAPTGVYAADATANITTTSATIDYSQKGSITLYKYLNNDGVTADADGIPLATTPENMLQAIKDKTGNDSIMPEKGVKFKLLKVADIDQVTEDTKGGKNVTGTYYTNIDQGFFDIMNSYLGTNALVASDSTKVTDGRTTDAASKSDDHYESDELNEKMMSVIRSTATAAGTASVKGEVAINRYVRQHAESENCKTFDLTNEYGYTKVEGLGLGLYLVAEIDFEHSALSKYDTYWEVVNDGNTTDTNSGGSTEIGGNGADNSSAGVNAGGSDYADIASPSSPFLVSVPMTNITEVNGHEAGTIWQYDITAYPKNGSINIHKDIVTNDYTLAPNSNGLKENDGQDTRNTETLCDFKQTNYDVDADGNESTSLDTPAYLTHQIDANIGDTVRQLVSVDVPRLTDDIDNEQVGANRDTVERKHNEKFVVTDRMTKGLQLIDHSSFRVTLGTGAWNAIGNTALVENTDYTLKFGADGKSYVLTMTAEGLHKMDDIPSASYLYVLYDCEVTKDALIGTDTYASQRVVTKTPVADGVSGNQGETEEQLRNDGNTVSDNFTIDDSKLDTSYDVTYPAGVNDESLTTVKHPEAVNQNTAQLTYSTDRTQEHDYFSNTTKVFTYELDLTKTFTDGTKGHISKTDEDGTHGNSKEFDYSKVKFTIRGEVAEGSKGSADAVANKTTGLINGVEDAQTVTGGDADFEQLLFIRTGDGTYRVWDKYTDGGGYVASTDAYATLDTYNADADTIERAVDDVAINDTITKYVTPNSKTGLLTIRGLDDRVYELTEVATAPGRNLMAEKIYVELKAPATMVANGQGGQNEVKLENGSVQHAYVWSGDPRSNGNYDIGTYAAALSRMNEGRVPLSIQNNEIIKVLKTGGKGAMPYVFGGTALLCGGVAILFVKKKKEEEADAEC